MNNLAALYSLILSCAWILALIVFYVMKHLFKTRKFFNVIGFFLVFISTLSFLCWFNLDQINMFLAKAPGQEPMQLKAASWSIYGFITCAWYGLSMVAKKRCDW